MNKTSLLRQAEHRDIPAMARIRLAVTENALSNPAQGWTRTPPGAADVGYVLKRAPAGTR